MTKVPLVLFLLFTDTLIRFKLISQLHKYSYGRSLSYGYLIGPMKMRSLRFRKSIIDPKNAGGLLNWWYIFQMGLELSMLLICGFTVVTEATFSKTSDIDS